MKFEKEEKTQQRSNEGLCLKWAKTLFPFFCVSFSVCPFYIFLTISVLCLSLSLSWIFVHLFLPVYLWSFFLIFPFSLSLFLLFIFSVSLFYFLFQTTKPIISESNSGVMFWYQLITRNAHSHTHILSHTHTHILTHTLSHMHPDTL